MITHRVKITALITGLAVMAISDGLMAMLDASGAAHLAISTTLPVPGVAIEAADSENCAAGEITVKTELGSASRFENSVAAGEITRADIGAACLVVDFETVFKSDRVATRLAVGLIDDVGAAGDISVKTERGAVWRFENSAGADEITRADIEADCFVVDFQTVAKTNGTNTRVVAGVIDDVDADGVWVRI